MIKRAGWLASIRAITWSLPLVIRTLEVWLWPCSPIVGAIRALGRTASTVGWYWRLVCSPLADVTRIVTLSGWPIKFLSGANDTVPVLGSIWYRPTVWPFLVALSCLLAWPLLIKSIGQLLSSGLPGSLGLEIIVICEVWVTPWISWVFCSWIPKTVWLKLPR